MRKKDEEYEEIEISIDEPIYTSGVVQRLLGIPVWVLKQLDREKLVSPSRQKGGGRVYSQSELRQLRYLWFLIDKRGVNVQGLRVILEMKGVIDEKKVPGERKRKK